MGTFFRLGELDPDHPRRHFDPRAHFTHYFNLKKCRRRFVRLLSDFRFRPLEEVVADVGRAADKTPAPFIEARPAHVPGSLTRRAEALGEYLGGLPSGSVVLDVGTGDGEVLSRLLEETGPALAVGIDLQRQPLRTHRCRGRAVLLQGNAEAIPLISDCVDAVICASTFKHVWDAPKMISELSRVLSPRGILVLLDVSPFGISLGLAAGHQEHGAVHRTLGLYELCGMLEEAGLKVTGRRRFMALPWRSVLTRALERVQRILGLERLLLYHSATARKP